MAANLPGGHGFGKWLHHNQGPLMFVLIVVLLSGAPLYLPERAFVEHYHENLLSVVHLVIDIVGLAALIHVFARREMERTNGEK